MSPAPKRSARQRATREAVARTTEVADPREAARSLDVRAERPPRAPGDRDPFTGELRKRDILPPLMKCRTSSGRMSRLRSSPVDRKSTRLNSSHDQISYAVFCLKKKNKSLRVQTTPR